MVCVHVCDIFCTQTLKLWWKLASFVVISVCYLVLLNVFSSRCFLDVCVQYTSLTCPQTHPRVFVFLEPLKQLVDCFKCCHDVHESVCGSFWSFWRWRAAEVAARHARSHLVHVWKLQHLWRVDTVSARITRRRRGSNHPPAIQHHPVSSPLNYTSSVFTPWLHTFTFYFVLHPVSVDADRFLKAIKVM